MRLRISIVIITAALLCGVSDLRAGLNFQLDRTFTIPDLSGSVNQMRFNDIDGDGVPEVLARNADKVVLYSISGDSIIFSADPDSGYEISAIELADVNRDSVADVVYTSRRYVDSLVFPTPLIAVTKCLSGASAFAKVAEDIISGSTSSWGSVATLAATDIDLDGYNEMLVSVDSVYSYMLFGIWWEYWTVGRNVVYRSFPSPKSVRAGYITGFKPERWPDGQTAVVQSNYGEYYSEVGVDKYSVRGSAAIVDSAEASHALPSISESYPCFGGSDYVWTSAVCVGELDGDTTTRELLLRQSSSAECTDTSLSLSSSLLTLYEFDYPSVGELRWSIGLAGKSYLNFIYHPNLPGYFFAFSGDTLVLFRGSDGSVHSKLIDVPTGTRYWDYPYGDGIPRLIVTNGAQVSFYNLDVTTGAEDEPSHSLPNAFAIGQPYPNPFNAELTVPVTLSKSQDVAVDVFNIVGERVVRLHEGKGKAGENLIRWDASGVSSGIYLIRVQAAGETRTVKAVLLK